MIVETQAIVLSSIKYGDSSRIVRLFAKEHGRISVIAKGARQIKSKFGAALIPLNCINIQFYKKHQRDLHTLSSAETACSFRKLQESPEHLISALMMAESISFMLEEHEVNDALYDIFLTALNNLNLLPVNPLSHWIAFQFQLARIAGFELNFSSEIPVNSATDYYFSLESGVLLSSSQKFAQHTFRISAAELELLRGIASLPPDDYGSLSNPAPMAVNIIEFFTRYFSFHTDKKIRYKSFSLLSDF